jgi:hypothetical protein
MPVHAMDSVACPLEAHREVAGKRGYDALEHAPEIRRHVALFTLTRVVWNEWLAVEKARREPTWPVSVPTPERISLDTAWQRLLGARSEGERLATWSAIEAGSAALKDPLAHLRERRFEAAKRLGLSHPDALGTNAPLMDVAAAARTFLDATDDLAREVFERHRRRHPELSDVRAAFFDHVLARDAQEGWPAQLLPRWFDDLFGSFGGAHRLPESRLPDVVGGASFMRALARFGEDIGRPTRTSRSAIAFTTAHDPYRPRALARGAVFAHLLGWPVFQRKALGLSAGAARDAAHVFSCTLLHHARKTAARTVRAENETIDAGEWAHFVERVFRFRWSGAGWPTVDPLDAVRFESLARGIAESWPTLVQTHDEDWFENPRALSAIEASSRFAREEGNAVPIQVARLVRHFEEALE